MNALVRDLRPVGCPPGVNARTWRQAIEARLNELLDQSFALITALDMMDVDPDFELNGDDEPSLGWTDRGPQALYPDAPSDDREGDDEREQDPAECGIADYDALELMGWLPS